MAASERQMELMSSYWDAIVAGRRGDPSGMDPGLAETVDRLQALGTRLRPDPDFTSRLRRELLEVVAARPRRWQRPSWLTLPVAAMLALLLLLLLAAVGYAVASLVGQVWPRDPGLSRVDQSRLVRELNLSQTVDGLTLTVERAYADENRVSVGLLAELGGRFGADYEADYLPPGEISLTDESGRAYRQSLGMGSPNAAGAVGRVLTFDAEGLKPGEATLTLTVTRMAVRESRTRALAATAEGPWAFRFTVPVAAGREVRVSRPTDATNRTDVTLERLVVTPAETKAYLRLEPPAGYPVPQLLWKPMVTISGDGFAYQSAMSRGPYPDGSYVAVFFDPLYERSGGGWTLSVSYLRGPGWPGIWHQGPWAFTVLVPGGGTPSATVAEPEADPEGADVVRRFVGDPGLALVSTPAGPLPPLTEELRDAPAEEVAKVRPRAPREQEREYATPNRTAFFTVDREAGLVTYALFADGWGDGAPAAVSREQAEPVARAFAAARIPGFERLVGPTGAGPADAAPHFDYEAEGREYTFQWADVGGSSGAMGLHRVSVAVDAATGRARRFVQSPPAVPSVGTEPAVGRERAVAIARERFADAHSGAPSPDGEGRAPLVLEVAEVGLEVWWQGDDPDEGQVLRWRVGLESPILDVRGQPVVREGEEQVLREDYFVDAQSGTILRPIRP